MSVPNYPDLAPYLGISCKDAVNLLLTSVALEEISISRLLEAENNKIVCVLNDCKDDCKHKGPVLPDVIKVNKSVEEMVKLLIKFQMLLEFKLDSIKEFLPEGCPKREAEEASC